MRCRTCGYDLQGLEEHRCPECGRAFDPFDPQTFQQWPYRGRRYVVLAIMGAAMLGAPFLLPVLLDLGWIRGRQLPTALPLIVVLLMFGGFALTWYVCTIGFAAIIERLPWVEDRIAFACALGIGVLSYGALLAWALIGLVRNWGRIF